MYPTVVMILVETQRRPVASDLIDARFTTALRLSFAVGPSSTTTDTRAQSQPSYALTRQGGQEHEVILEGLSSQA